MTETVDPVAAALAEAAQATAPAKEAKAPKERKPRAPKLDADGNPIPPKPRQSNVFLESQVLTLNPEKTVSYREGTKRHDFYKLIKDGMTVGEYYKAAGGKSVGHTYLVWYITADKSVLISGTSDA